MPEKILVIDDDHNICYMLSRLIEKEGYSCTEAHSLKQGLKEAEEGEYGLIFLDIYLPDGNGLNKLSNFLQAQSLPEVIIITGQ